MGRLKKFVLYIYRMKPDSLRLSKGNQKELVDALSFTVKRSSLEPRSNEESSPGSSIKKDPEDPSTSIDR